MNAIQVQGTKTFILEVPGTPFADCLAAVAAILAGAEALCPQGLGELTRTRAVNEYSCISSNDSTKSTGKITYGDFSIDLLFDPADTAGQKELFDAMEDNTPVIIGMMADNGTTSGDIVWTEALVSGDAISYPVDGLMGYNVTLAPYGGFNRCPAV